MIKVGLTGGIGSGKSVVCQIFAVLGIPIYFADERAKHLINTNHTLQTEITEVFGKDSFTAEGYNKNYIASIVFKDAKLLNKLNNIVHPKVAVDFENWYRQQNSCHYIIHEAAILFESGAYQKMDKIIIVDAPMQLRIKRVKERDSISEEDIMDRMRSQLSIDQYKPYASWIIFNDDNELILPQVLAIHNHILNFYVLTD